MKTRKQITLLLIAVLLCSVQYSKAQTAYLVTVAAGKTTEVLKTTQAAAADSLINICLCKEFCVKHEFIHVKTALQHTAFIEIRTEGLTVYCEKEKVKKMRRGKLKLKTAKR